MTPDEEMGKLLLSAKIIQIAYLGAVLIYLIMLFIVIPYAVGPLAIFPAGDPLLTLFEGVLGVLAVIIIALAYLLPRWTVRWYRQKSRRLFNVYFIRGGLFEAVAIYGLILGILGAKWPIILPFFIVGAATLVHTFPTEERWGKMYRCIYKANAHSYGTIKINSKYNEWVYYPTSGITLRLGSLKDIVEFLAEVAIL